MINKLVDWFGSDDSGVVGLGTGGFGSVGSLGSLWSDEGVLNNSGSFQAVQGAGSVFKVFNLLVSLDYGCYCMFVFAIGEVAGL